MNSALSVHTVGNSCVQVCQEGFGRAYIQDTVTTVVHLRYIRVGAAINFLVITNI